MELNSKTIHMNCIKGRTQFSVSIDEDCTISDGRPEMEHKIKDMGEVCVEKIKVADDRVSVGGSLNYRLLYYGDNKYCTMEGKIPFEDGAVMDGATPQDIISCNAVLEDMSVTVINPAKINIRAVIVIHIDAEMLYDKNIVSDVYLKQMQSIDRKLDMLTIGTSRKDILRIREAVNLRSELPEIGQILWHELKIKGMDVRACDSGLIIKGELGIMALYSDNSEIGTFCFSDTVPFSEKLDMSGWKEEMYPQVSLLSTERSLIARADGNGEARIFDAEVILNLEARGYYEDSINVLSDVYAPGYELIPDAETVNYEKLVMKKSAKSVCEGRFKLPATDDPIIRIVNSSGKIIIEDYSMEKDSVRVDGAVVADVMYEKDSPTDRIGAIRYEIPFSERMEALGITKDCIMDINASVVNASATMTAGNELEVKCDYSLELFARNKCTEEVITGIIEKQADMEAIKKLPGMVGYIVKEGDTLWNIAKRYSTTVSNIMEDNGLTSDVIKPGMRLMILKLYCV